MCGIFGVFNVPKAAELTVIGLHGNQHRAIDYAGVVSSDGTHLYRERGSGLARQVFTKDVLNRLHGKHALGHVRYPTVADDPTRDNVQPVLGSYRGMPFALVHNGNLTNHESLQSRFRLTCATSMDTEIIVRLCETFSGMRFEDALIETVRELRGSFSLGVLTPHRLYAIRDPRGNRPLSVGYLNGGHCISSETCVFPNLDVRAEDEVQPGTMLVIERGTIEVRHFQSAKQQKCRFEGIYFSHPSSRTFGEQVSRFRYNLGKVLEEVAPIPGGADIVTPVPDSATFIALGYGSSGRSGSFFPVITRNHYVGRTFIAATQAGRDTEVSQKFNFTPEEVEGKRVVVVDDSIVRGTTSAKLIHTLRSLGAKRVHVRVGSPPIMHPCRYGIDTKTEGELISANMSTAEICKKIGADSLEFLPLEVLKKLSPDASSWCFACMNGEYWD